MQPELEIVDIFSIEKLICSHLIHGFRMCSNSVISHKNYKQTSLEMKVVKAGGKKFIVSTTRNNVH